MRIEDRLERCKWATERVNAVLGGDRYAFKFNEKTHEFEFWEVNTPKPQCIFPLDLNGEPLSDITDWEIEYAIKFVRRRRRNAE